VAIFGNLFGQIFGDSAAELEAQGDYFAGVNNWKRATDEYRRALQRTNKNSIGYRRLAAKFDDARLKSFDALVDEIHSHIDVREFTYASDQLALARSMAETDEQRDRLEECERRLRGVGRSSLAAAQAQRGTPVHAEGAATDRDAAMPAARLDASSPVSQETGQRPAAAMAPAARAMRGPTPDQSYQKILSRLPAADAAARVRLGTTYRDAVLALARGEAAHAVELFQQALQEHPDEALVLYDMASALAASGRSREAISIYYRIAERNPRDWQPQYEIALLQWGEGLRDRAVATIEEGLERHPHSGYLMAQWGVFLYKLGDRRGALEKFYQALQLDSFDDAGLYHVLANLHLELGEAEKARRGYLKALELNPASIGTMLDYAEYLVDSKRDAHAALAILETAFRSMRASPTPKLQHAYRSFLCSKAHMLLGAREMALLDVTRALEENDQAWLEDTLEMQRQTVLAV
jgi:tetratricopeptide (TPR) repeat protein